MVRILVDGDACPVRGELLKLHQKYPFEWWIFIDVNHQIEETEANVMICDQGKDSVDLVLLKHAQSHDLVVTGDLGLAGLALAKGCYVLDFNGRQILEDEMDALLWERSLYQKLRRQGKHSPRQKPRRKTDNMHFYHACQEFLEGFDD